MTAETPKTDRALTDKEEALIEKLSCKDLELIDAALLSYVKNDWRKVAMVVAMTMMDLSNKFKGLPDAFYSQRVGKLAKDGLLESQGDLQYMRFSEVRLPNIKNENQKHN